MKIPKMFAVGLLALALVPGCDGSNGGSGPNGGSADGDGVVDLAPGEFEPIDIDNCTLLTDEEVSAYADDELIVDEDTPLGCGWIEAEDAQEEFPVHQFSVQALRGGGDSKAAAPVLVNDPEQVIELSGVGDDAVAVSTYGEVINWVIARQGDLFVVLNVTFVGHDPTPEDLERSGQLAATALGRLVEAV